MVEATRRPSTSLARGGTLLPDYDAGDRPHGTPLPLRRVLCLPRLEECFDAGPVGQLAQRRLAVSKIAEVPETKLRAQPTPEPLDGVEVWGSRRDRHKLDVAAPIQGPSVLGGQEPFVVTDDGVDYDGDACGYNDSCHGRDEAANAGEAGDHKGR